METTLQTKQLGIPITSHLIDDVAGLSFRKQETFTQSFRITTALRGTAQSKTAVEAWLEDRLGEDFDSVYLDFQKEVQPQFLDGHRKGIFWFVEKKSAILMDTLGKPRYKGGLWFVSGFYVNPATNKLCRTR